MKFEFKVTIDSSEKGTVVCTEHEGEELVFLRLPPLVDSYEFARKFQTETNLREQRDLIAGVCATSIGSTIQRIQKKLLEEKKK